MIKRNRDATENMQAIEHLEQLLGTHMGNWVTCRENVQIKSVTIAIKMDTSQMSDNKDKSSGVKWSISNGRDGDMLR